MSNLVPVGDVHVTPADCKNPYTYRGTYYNGPERVAALLAFRNGEADGRLVLWSAPAFGGARRITAAEVDWERAGL